MAVFNTSKTRVGDDGTIYEWNAEVGGWFPQALPAFDPSAVFDPSADDQIAASRKRKLAEEEEEAKKKAAKEPKKKVNSSIYVTNLPQDVTVDEMKEVFGKYGIIMEDIATGLPRIKLYKDAEGNNKGDALVTYFKEESVKLAVDLLDESEFRFGDSAKIRVSQAVFQEKPRPPTAEAPKVSKVDKKKAQKKIQNLQKKLDWFEEEAGKKSEKISKIVIMKHMFTKQEIDVRRSNLLIDLKEEVREECEKLGEVTNVVMYDHSDEGVITVRFKETEAAAKCVEKNNGRFFGGRNKTAEEIQAEEEKRLAAFENWLEENH
ncbi:hypothetical protein BCR33DRAFT_719769 [Rhizoclosmatium globosum]|uniref:RRM domain-containing protein n=1 Tax=Rhizoclosmatium globosum TaxID=329046 RepID=A0A1Y2BZ17_9FUNG|nr:hypothetical protein BCR33DRAFT_719769 [Rhizoclosmatium globosum]|eukprot:ORY39966.1 hypothetical protein BCR33DRAFT_719769 [Rhizoclosmatium globosum]